MLVSVVEQKENLGIAISAAARCQKSGNEGRR
jgi:hypothetical protein